jgi:hypothetical protein
MRVLANKRTLLVGLLLMFSALVSQAQNDSLVSALKSLQAGNLDKAKAAIEAAIKHPETSNDAQAWYLRGFIYKDIYKTREESNKMSPARETAYLSFRKSLELDSSKSNRESNIASLKFLAAKYFNDAASTLDTTNYNISIKNFDKYKELMGYVDPAASMVPKDIEFNLAIASVYTKIYESNRKTKTAFFDLAKASYAKVLSLDPNNLSANYHMGILYYNQAVEIINRNIEESEWDIDLVKLEQIQDNSIALFKQSLPFMQKAYELDPNKRETLEGLTGIYFSLNEFEKSNEFKQRLEEIKKQR